jgi:hypothetical protein
MIVVTSMRGFGTILSCVITLSEGYLRQEKWVSASEEVGRTRQEKRVEIRLRKLEKALVMGAFVSANSHG